MEREKYSWVLSWYNELAAVDELYQLIYFVMARGSNELQIYDTKRRRLFLSRCQTPLRVEDIVIGGKVTVLSRQYRVVDFGDGATRAALGRVQQRTFGLVTASGLASNALGSVWAAAEASGLKVVNANMVYLEEDEAARLAGAMGARGGLAPGPVVLLELLGEDAVSAWSRVWAHFSPSAGGASHVLGCADAAADAAALDLCFGASAARGTAPVAKATMGVPAHAVAGPGGAGGEETSVAVLLPSLVSKGQAGVVMAELLEAASSPASSPLHLAAVGVFDLDRRTAEDYLEVYKGVEPAYLDMVGELCAGPAVVLQLRGADAVARIRAAAGPRDIDTAKRIRPASLRARYGASAGAPGVHVTDLAEDGPSEADFFFSLLEAQQSTAKA